MLVETEATGTKTKFPFSNRFIKKLLKPLRQPAKSTKLNKLSSSIIPEHEILNLYAITPLEGTTLTYTKIRFAPCIQRRALVDTAACANVVPKQIFEELKNEKSLFRPLVIAKSNLKRVRMAGGQTVAIETELTVEFRLANMTFTEPFLVLNSANSIILGNPFFKAHKIHIFPKYNLLKFPDVTLQSNEIKPLNKPRRINRVKKFPLTITKNT